MEQCCRSVDPVNKLAIRQGEKERQHGTEMHNQQQIHDGPIAKHQQQQPGQAGEEQQGDE
jgi:hypothetical protein